MSDIAARQKRAISGIMKFHEFGLQELSPDCLDHCERMHDYRLDAADDAVWLVENAKLSQHCSSVIIDFLTSKPIFAVERENAAERKLHWTPSWRQPAPRAQMMSADHDFQEYGIISGVTPTHVDGEVGNRAEQPIVIRTHGITADL